MLTSEQLRLGLHQLKDECDAVERTHDRRPRDRTRPDEARVLGPAEGGM